MEGSLGLNGMSSSSRWESGRESIIMGMGSRMTISRGTVCSRYFRTLFSKRASWMLVREVETPSSLTKDRIAPGGIPRRRSATSVKSLGSSQPRTTFSSTNFIIFRLERIVPVTLSRPYLYQL